MAMQRPTILALDFDGVICDGLVEYFQTAWLAYRRIWPESPTTPPPDLALKFYRLRPVVETGWEMPVLLHALMQGMGEAEILADWWAIAHQLVTQEARSPADLAVAVDSVRDAWIARDLEDWLAQHRFYPGVGDRLRTLEAVVTPYIITTKEGRFVQRLLAAEGIHWPEERIFGKEVKQPKHQTLRDLVVAQEAETCVWFIEDRLKTLDSVRQQPDLGMVRLFLADWGYNTEGDRLRAQQTDAITLLSLSAFTQDFAHWPDR